MSAETPGTWTAVGPLSIPVTGQVQVQLKDGRVLVAGGTSGGQPVASAEIYSPRTWHPAGTMSVPRPGASAALLPNGKVLVVGGVTAGNVVLASAELYDPGSNSWSTTGAMATARTSFSATTLATGRVLVTAGCPAPSCNYSTALATSELYDPVSGTWSATGSLATGRFGQTAVTLADGRVMVSPLTGTNLIGNPEIYDPAAGTWSPTGAMSYQYPIYATAAVLQDGRVLMLGGYPRISPYTIATELYTPATNSWTLGPPLLHLHQNFSATTLTTGQVLVAGGGYTTRSSGSGRGGSHTVVTPDATAEIFDPVTNTFALTGPMTSIRSGALATLLTSDEAVLVVGGSTSITQTEIYDPPNILTLAPGTLTFSGQLVLESGAPQMVTLTNHAAAALAIKSVGTSGDFSQTNNCPASLAQGLACALSVSFLPTAGGTRKGSLYLNFSDSPFSASVALTGVGLTQELTASPANVSLSTVSGTTTSTTLTILNAAPIPAPVGLTLAGTGFTDTTTCPANLASGQSCGVTITFAPTTTGAFSGTLTVAGAVGSQNVSLSGTGTPVALTVNPANIDFGPVVVGDNPSQSITVKNATAVSFGILSVIESGADFSLSDHCPSTLAAGKSCTIGVTFTPGNYVSYNGTVTIHDNQGGSHAVTLTGNGVADN